MAKKRKPGKPNGKKSKISLFDFITGEVPFHTLLIAAFPVIALFAHNASEVHVGTVDKPLYFTLFCTAVFFFILFIFIRDWKKTGLVTSVVSVTFVSYGQFFSLFKDASIGDLDLASHYVILPLALALAGWLIYFILSAKKYLRQVTLIANFMALLLVAMASYAAVDGVMKFQSKRVAKFNSVLGKNPLGDENAKKYPDIYYIILDGHARQDVMKQIYGFDNSFFINGLKDMGFYVAGKSRPNYCQTVLSLASSLNMEYHDESVKRLGTGEASRIYFDDMIRHPQVIARLRGYGYKWISYFSGFVGTELKRIADIYLPGEYDFAGDITNFESVFLDSTMISGIQAFINLGLQEKTGPHTPYRRRTRYVLERLHRSAYIKSPKIVFAHLICPHPPFVFDENGPTDKYAGTKGVQFTDGTQNSMPKAEYIMAYASQAKYLDTRLLQTMKDLLAGFPEGKKPIIILQADHGPGSGWDAENAEKTNINERFSILNAYYFPNKKTGLLYDSISPVNTFRVVFNTYFGESLPLLPDKYYFSSWSKPYNFIEVHPTN